MDAALGAVRIFIAALIQVVLIAKSCHPHRSAALLELIGAPTNMAAEGVHLHRSVSRLGRVTDPHQAERLKIDLGHPAHVYRCSSTRVAPVSRSLTRRHRGKPLPSRPPMSAGGR